MASKSRSKKNVPSLKDSFFSNTHLGEVLGIFFLTLTTFLSLALFSYSALDPSLDSSSHTSSVANLGGIIGAYSADALFHLLGGAAYLLLIIFLIMGVSSFIKNRPPLRLVHFCLLLFFTWTAAILFQLHSQTFIFATKEFQAGGFLGALIAEPLRHYLNIVGAYLMVISLGLLTFVWGTGVSLAHVGNFLKRFFVAFYFKAKSLSVVYYSRLKIRLEEYKQKRALQLKVREEELKKKKEEIKAAPVPVKINIPKALPTEENKIEKILKALPVEKTPAIISEKTILEDLGESEPKVFARQDVGREKKLEEQMSFTQMMKGFILPPITLLDNPEKQQVTIDEESLKMNSKILEKKLMDYGVEGRVTEIHPGPVVTMYEFEPAAGIKVSRIVGLQDDLSMSMGGRSVRVVSHLQGKAAVGIEIPNHNREIVYFKDLLADSKFQKSDSKLNLALGKDIEGLPSFSDLQKMPHLLVAGATGTGKSVGLNAMILSMLFRATPEEVRFIFVDPKMLELSIYQGIPHLLLPVVTDTKKAAVSLRWAVAEMERRYKLLSHAQVRNIASYNKKISNSELDLQETIEAPIHADAQPLKHGDKLPFIVIIIDELADLMLVAGREVEEYITRLAQMARAAGIHLILATQRPSVDVITGVIKANFPARISFKVSSAHDSRTIIDTRGSESLLGMGDMLFLPPGVAKLMRLHGAYVSDAEVMRVVEHLKKQGQPVYDESILNFKETKDEDAFEEDMTDELYDQAVSIVTETRQASISMVQRRLRIGYNRAARMIDRMESEGVVSAANGSKGREVLARSMMGDD